jgi:P27 family predicted phage terminase small subunit
MVRGRKRIPTAIHVAQGTHRTDRHGDPDAEPGIALHGTPEAPSGIGESGRRAWETVLPTIAAAGYLANLDLHAFERFCRLHDDLADCERVIEEDGAYHVTDGGSIQQHPAVNRRLKIIDLLRRYEIDFWLNPTARAGKQVASRQARGVATRARSG